MRVTQSADMEQEFREFVAARSGALLRTAYLLAGDWATAEDLLQTALTKTYLAWKRLGQIEAVEPYTRRVLVNTATSWWRRRWHGERPTEVLPEQPGPDRHEEAVERDALWQHVRTLPARQRAVLVLRFYEDLSEAQTADLLDISIGTVKSQTARALATLRRRLGTSEAVPDRVAPAGTPPVDASPTPAPASSAGGSSRASPSPASPVGAPTEPPVAPTPQRQPRTLPMPAMPPEPAPAYPAGRGDRG
jgi:RNA polymerase sigma-70 factor, ECF subfamily